MPVTAILNRQDCSTHLKMRPSSAVLQDRPQEYEQARGKYIIDNNTMQILSKDAVIMHPLPRVDEVSLPPACTGHRCGAGLTCPQALQHACEPWKEPLLCLSQGCCTLTPEGTFPVT